MSKIVGKPIALPRAEQRLARSDDLWIVDRQVPRRFLEHDLAHVGGIGRDPPVAGEEHLGAAMLRLGDDFRAGAERLVAELRRRDADAIDIARRDAGGAHQADEERIEIGALTAQIAGLELTELQVQVICERLAVAKAPAAERVFALSAPVWLQFKRGLLATLQSFHAANPDLPGIGLERLRLQLQPRLPAPAFLLLLQGLVRNREIALDGAWVRLAGHEVRLTPEDEKIWSRIAALLGGGERFRPPRVRDIATLLALREPDVRRLLKVVGRLGKADQGRARSFFPARNRGGDGRDCRRSRHRIGERAVHCGAVPRPRR